MTHRSRRAVATVFVIAALALAACAGSDGRASDSTKPAASVVGAAATKPTVVTSTAPKAPANRCAVTVAKGDTMRIIADRGGVTLKELLKENSIDIKSTIHPGEVFDVCIGNKIDDVIGSSRIAPPVDAVTRQQEELNDLFSTTSMLPLTVDGDSGRYTRQMACAARMALGLRVHAGHIVPGSAEEKKIFAATKFGIPKGAPTDARKWILIDQTCQVIFTGEGDKKVVDIYPTSTGIEDFPTRNTQALAFRFDPALETDGWHDSETFPSADDAPGNGNMYKPLYFNRGQAIHGARFIPPMPRSHGCARTFPQHQDKIIKWLGLNKRKQAVWDTGGLGVTVLVRGRYRDLGKA